jgi:hypothetical protein
LTVCAYFSVWWRGRAEAFSRGGDLLSSGAWVRPCGGSTPGATSTGWPLVPAPYSLILPLRTGCLCARTLHSNGLDGLSLTIYLTRLPGGRSPSLLGDGGAIPPWVTQAVRHRRRLEHTHATHPHTRHVCTYSLPHARLTLVRRPAVAATGRRLHLYHYGRRLSSSVGNAAAALADAAHHRQHAPCGACACAVHMYTVARGRCTCVSGNI